MAQTRWSDAFSYAGLPKMWGGTRFGSRIVDSQTKTVAASPSDTFATTRQIGGKTGWYYGNWLWRVRGFLDLLVGGVGIRRGRRDTNNLCVGDALDFWRVENFEPGRLLQPQAEIKLPGQAWLELKVAGEANSTTLRQTAIFDQIGLFGLAYWYAHYPLHQLIFTGMLRNMVHRAEKWFAAKQLSRSDNVATPK